MQAAKLCIGSSATHPMPILADGAPKKQTPSASTTNPSLMGPQREERQSDDTRRGSSEGEGKTPSGKDDEKDGMAG